MYCISYNLYKYIQRLSLLNFSRRRRRRGRGSKGAGRGRWGGGFLLHRCKVKRVGFGH